MPVRSAASLASFRPDFIVEQSAVVGGSTPVRIVSYAQDAAIKRARSWEGTVEKSNYRLCHCTPAALEAEVFREEAEKVQM
jgi:hypothetical protein